MSRRLIHFALLLVLCFASSACNRVGLAYRNLDVIIPWTLNRNLDEPRDAWEILHAQTEQNLTPQPVHRPPRGSRFCLDCLARGAAGVLCALEHGEHP